jgi:hypothetical protein
LRRKGARGLFDEAGRLVRGKILERDAAMRVEEEAV